MRKTFDSIIVGGGIAGLSVGYYLARSHQRVLILERENQGGYHSTGRAVAIYRESNSYNNPVILSLSRGSKPFFVNPPADFSEYPLFSQRSVVFVARKSEEHEIDPLWRKMNRALGNIEQLSEPPVETIPLTGMYSKKVLLDREVYDIDSHRLQEGYRSQIKKQGGFFQTCSEVVKLSQVASGWTVATAENSFVAPVIINAAGAWADNIAAMAGIQPLGLKPLRRTVVSVKPKSLQLNAQSPIVMDFKLRFYIKPEHGRLLVSPADEHLCPACDAQPEEIDIAIAADRLREASGITITHIDNAWAGLRTFAEDRYPVIGFSGEKTGFFWLAGQGGVGIQTAPAVGRLAASLVLGNGLPADLANAGISESAIGPGRLEKKGEQ